MSKEFISSDRNDSFAFLKGIDLQDLLIETENYFLEYRDKLNLPDYLTIGIELEYEGFIKYFTDKFIEKNLIRWNSKSDGSLLSGGEITSPIMFDEQKNWKDLKIICDYLTKKRADTLHNAGGHIHIGTCVLGDDIEAWRLFLKLYTSYENVLFRFLYGDKINGRKKLLKYAKPIADILYENMESINEITCFSEIKYYVPKDTKYLALNFKNVSFYNPNRTNYKNTLEFRSPNATTNAVVWQNNINTLAKMLVSSRKKVMDEEFLDYKLKKEFLSYSDNKYLYDNVILKNALEFVDLIFDNNLDKVYFLRQYLKDFQDSYGIKTTVNAKRFVRR